MADDDLKVVYIVGQALEHLKAVANEAAGNMSVNTAHSVGLCVQCRQPARDRCHTPLAEKEWLISGLCGECWDDIMADTEEE